MGTGTTPKSAREGTVSVILPGVPATGDERRAIKSSIIVLLLRSTH
jgi:hypothetical protein